MQIDREILSTPPRGSRILGLCVACCTHRWREQRRRGRGRWSARRGLLLSRWA